MSKHETPLTRWYHRQVGGTLIEEFVAVRDSADCGRRVLDGVIVFDGQERIARQPEVSLENRDIIVVQTKIGRLNMYLLGQALFSADLMRSFNPRSILTVALCTRDDSVLRPLFERYPGAEVVVGPESLPPETAEETS